MLDDWLRGGLNVAFYRAADHRLLARAVDPDEHPSGWLFSARYRKAQVASLYTNFLSAKADVPPRTTEPEDCEVENNENRELDGTEPPRDPVRKQTPADPKRVLDPDPHTLSSRDNLARAYEAEGDLGRAIPLYERTLADAERALGPDHPNTLTSRSNLAGAYEAKGDLDRAIPLYEQTLADCERVLGPNHPDTLTTRKTAFAGGPSAGRVRALRRPHGGFTPDIRPLALDLTRSRWGTAVLQTNSWRTRDE
nr:tetratricopeptide repeat protein [Streptomyces sp. NBC_00830]